MNNNELINRSIYREFLNNLCADYSLYRLKHKVNNEFLEIESKLWDYREKALYMENDNINDFDDFILKATAFLLKKEIFN